MTPASTVQTVRPVFARTANTRPDAGWSPQGGGSIIAKYTSPLLIAADAAMQRPVSRIHLTAPVAASTAKIRPRSVPTYSRSPPRTGGNST